jgi:sulfonate transport system substrate-binding protein
MAQKLSRRAVAAGALLAPVLLSRNARAAPLDIRVGWATMPGHMIPVLFNNPDILRHYGKSYTVTPILFRGSSPQLTAMAAGEVDFAAYSPLTLALSVLNAHLDMRAVADIIQDGVPGYYAANYLVRADSGIDTVQQLKGKRIATNAIGSAVDTAMRAMLKRAGLLDRRDYVTIQAAFPSMPALLEQKKVDMSVILLPEVLPMLASGKFKTLFTARDGWGQTEAVFLAARGEFLDKNQAVAADFMEDWVRAMRWYQAPANRAKAIGIIADFMKVPPARLSYLFTKKDYYRDPWSRVNVVGIQNPINVSKDLGLIPTTIQVAPKYVDYRFTDEARKRIASA